MVASIGLWNRFAEQIRHGDRIGPPRKHRESFSKDTESGDRHRHVTGNPQADNPSVLVNKAWKADKCSAALHGRGQRQCPTSQATVAEKNPSRKLRFSIIRCASCPTHNEPISMPTRTTIVPRCSTFMQRVV